MDSTGRSLVTLVAAASFVLAPQWAHAQALEPIVYVVQIPAPDTHMIEVLATVPTSGPVRRGKAIPEIGRAHV